jgi:hypothetical protein
LREPPDVDWAASEPAGQPQYERAPGTASSGVSGIWSVLLDWLRRLAEDDDLAKRFIIAWARAKVPGLSRVPTNQFDYWGWWLRWWHEHGLDFPPNVNPFRWLLSRLGNRPGEGVPMLRGRRRHWWPLPTGLDPEWPPPVEQRPRDVEAERERLRGRRDSLRKQTEMQLAALQAMIQLVGLTLALLEGIQSRGYLGWAKRVRDELRGRKDDPVVKAILATIELMVDELERLEEELKAVERDLAGLGG